MATGVSKVGNRAWVSGRRGICALVDLNAQPPPNMLWDHERYSLEWTRNANACTVYIL